MWSFFVIPKPSKLLTLNCVFISSSPNSFVKKTYENKVTVALVIFLILLSIFSLVLSGIRISAGCVFINSWIKSSKSFNSVTLNSPVEISEIEKPIYSLKQILTI